MSIGRLARISNMALGLWLFVSAFVWAHTPAERVNVSLVGLFVTLTALSAWTTAPRLRLRFANAALGAWLLVSIIAFPARSIATAINSAVVGTLVFMLALMPSAALRDESASSARPWSGYG